MLAACMRAVSWRASASVSGRPPRVRMSTTRALRSRVMSFWLRLVVSICTVSLLAGNCAAATWVVGVGRSVSDLGSTRGARAMVRSSLGGSPGMRPTPRAVVFITSRSKVPKSVMALVPSTVVQPASASVAISPKAARPAFAAVRMAADCPVNAICMQIPLRYRRRL